MASNKKNVVRKDQGNGAVAVELDAIQSAADLKQTLLSIRDKMSEGAAAPVFCAGIMNHLLTMSNIYQLLDEGNKEIARDIWLRLIQSGLQLTSPPMLFGAAEEIVCERV